MTPLNIVLIPTVSILTSPKLIIYKIRLNLISYITVNHIIYYKILNILYSDNLSYYISN